MTSNERVKNVTWSLPLPGPSAVVDRPGGYTALGVVIMDLWHVSTPYRSGHYCRPVSAGAANHVTLGELRTRARRPVQQQPDMATRQQGAW
jgi:hypothetical protein